MNLQRQYNDELTLGVQHQLTPRLAVGAMFYKRKIADMWFEDRPHITLNDWTAIPNVPYPAADILRDPDVAAVVDPNGTMTIYNLVASKGTTYNQGIIDSSDTDNEAQYTGIEVSFNTRLPGGAMLFGSWTADHTLQQWCDTDDNPNGPTSTGQFSASDATTGVAASFGGRFCDQTQFDYPLRHEFKLAGNYSLRWGIDFGAVLQSYAGTERVISWTPPVSAYPGGVRTRTDSVVLNEPGSLFWNRWNQLDINIKKNIRHNNHVLTFQVDVFNVLNENSIRAGNNTIGSTLGQVTTIMTGRFPRLAVNYKF